MQTNIYTQRHPVKELKSGKNPHAQQKWMPLIKYDTYRW